MPDFASLPWQRLSAAIHSGDCRKAAEYLDEIVRSAPAAREEVELGRATKPVDLRVEGGDLEPDCLVDGRGLALVAGALHVRNFDAAAKALDAAIANDDDALEWVARGTKAVQ